MSLKPLSGTHPSELPFIIKDTKQLGNGRYRIRYMNPPIGFTTPALRDIEIFKTTIYYPAKFEGGPDMRTIEISETDYVKVVNRVDSKEEAGLWQQYREHLEAEKNAAEETLSAMEALVPGAQNQAYLTVCAALIRDLHELLG
ncbi:hypothetical protein DPSP01_013387 [Paraphaeosphaeria sporulosa]